MASLFSAKERYLFNSNHTSSDQSWKTSPKPVIQGFNNVPGYRNGNSFGQDLNLDYPNGVVTSTLAYSEPQTHLSYGEALRSASPVPISKSGRSSKISVLSDLNPPLRRAQSHPRMGVSNNNSMNMNGEGHHSLGRAYPTGSYSHHSLARTEQSVGLGDRTWKGTSACIAFLLLTSSLFLIGTGSGLMGFYRIHYLDMVAVEFLLVPLLMVIGGLITMLNAIFGFYINVKETSCLMITYAVILIIQLLLLISAIVLSIRLIFEIQTGIFDTNVVSEMAFYDTNQWTRNKWDTLQREYTCCGAYNFNQGYLAWKQTVLGADRNSVPDSCCLHESAHCGQGIFVKTFVFIAEVWMNLYFKEDTAHHSRFPCHNIASAYLWVSTRSTFHIRVSFHKILSPSRRHRLNSRQYFQLRFVEHGRFTLHLA